MIKALALLPFALLFSATNAFNEEVSFRSGLLAPLNEAVGKSHALALTAIFFGLAHYSGGVPLATLPIAWVDSRPTWDDTGITVGMLLIATGLLGLASPKGAWVWALAVGSWISAFGIIAHQNYGLILVLGIAFVGAYAGALIRKAFTTTKTGEVHE